MVDFDNGLV